LTRWANGEAVNLITADPAGLTAAEVLTATARECLPFLRGRPALLRELVTAGRQPRAGHDRSRWKSVSWDDYRAPVASARCGKQSIEMRGSGQCWPGEWIAEVEDIPWRAGRFACHIWSGSVVLENDAASDCIGRLGFMDRAGRQHGGRWLITGLGLGVVPSWLLRRAWPHRVDVVEIDADVVQLHRAEPWATRHATVDPLLHLYAGDATSWDPPTRGCELHHDCLPAASWTGALHDCWPFVSPLNLPQMNELEARYASRCGWQMSVERPEVEARHQRAQDGGELAAVAAHLSHQALIFLAGLRPFGGAHTHIYRAELAHRERT
jgi:hypothetical protein